jgi:hypothetical protein
MIPGTSSPSTAFVDQSAVSIKYSYWNGQQFITEIIAGDGGGGFVRLAYLPNGTPMVFWTYGGNLKMAVRSAAPSAAGTWTAGIIDTGVAPRATEVAVSPLGQVLVSFLTDTAVTGRVKFVYCGTGCSNPSSFQTMSPNPYIDNTNVIAGEMATGAAWCKVSATSYYPVVTYAVTGATKYAVCTSTLTNCTNSSNWTLATITASASAASKVFLDPSVTGDVPNIVVSGASGITPYVGSAACNLAPGSFTAGTVMGTSTSGNLWMSLMKDGGGLYHLVANDGTATVKYFNSTTTTLTSSWNSAGVVESTTLANPSAGGADIDKATSGIYASYGMAVIPYDLHLAKITNYTVASNLATFTLFTPDLTGNLQLGAAGTQLRNIAMATNPAGVPGVAYVDYSVGAVANAKLKFALRGGTTSSSPWIPYIVPDTINPQFPSLTFDSGGNPWISFFEAATNKFYLMTNSSNNGSGTWNSYVFPAIPSGAPIALPAANNTAVTMISVSGVQSPVMLTTDTNASSKGIRAAVFNPVTKVWSVVAVVDNLTSGANGAAHLTADSDGSENIVIAYQDLSVGRVKYSYSNGGLTWSTPIIISSVNQGVGATIRINPRTDQPAVSYYDQTNNLVFYNSCSGTIASCATSGWTPQEVEGAAGVSGLSASTGQFLRTGLTYNALGTPMLAYARGQTNDGNLVVWQNQNGNYFSAATAGGVNGNLVGSPALNFAVAGWSLASTPNHAGQSTTAYIGPGNWLYANSCGD